MGWWEWLVYMYYCLLRAAAGYLRDLVELVMLLFFCLGLGSREMGSLLLLLCMLSPNWFEDVFIRFGI